MHNSFQMNFREKGRREQTNREPSLTDLVDGSWIAPESCRPAACSPALAHAFRKRHGARVEAVDDLDECRPRDEEPLLALSVEKGRSPSSRFWDIGVTFLGATVATWQAAQHGRLDIIAGVVLPGLFVVVGLLVAEHKPVRSTLRFFHDAVEFDSDSVWIRVAWPLITRLVKDRAGGAFMVSGEITDGDRFISYFKKAELDELLAAGVLPAHVELIEAPAPATPPSAKTVLLLSVALVMLLVGIYSLVEFLLEQ